MKNLLYFSLLLLLASCSRPSSEELTGNTVSPEKNIAGVNLVSTSEDPGFYYGADLSYVNEMLDCGAVYKDADGREKNPYDIFAEAGTNIVRVRLWHNPTWTEYSDLADVEKTIQNAKDRGMRVLLDFHYSDEWTDPSKQLIPAAWESEIDNTPVLGDLMYDYTYSTLDYLDSKGLMPDIVQVGNETNKMILNSSPLRSMDWERNSFLLNKGIQAVRDVSADKNYPVEVMLHIAAPENALWWFRDATQNGVTDFDWIGVSYYPLWSDYDLSNVGEAFTSLVNTYNKKLMVVETAYPFTMEGKDAANNVMGTDAVMNGYPATQEGQLNYLLELERVIKASGGDGMVYWEPAWVSTDCYTQWGQGSHWENATLFDFNDRSNLGMEFFSGSFTDPVSCDAIWATGEGLTNSGWSWDSPAAFTCDNGVQAATVSLKNASFRFFTVKDDWTSGQNYSYYEADGYSIDPLLQNDNSQDQNFYFNGTPGLYSVTIDNVQKSINVKPEDPYYIIGDALTGGWSWDAPAEAIQVQTGIRRISLYLDQGKFRFFKTQNDWNDDMGYNDFISLGYTIDSALKSAGDADDNFSYTGKRGTFTLIINDINKTIVLQ